MKTRGKVIVAGHICLDVTPVFPGNGRMGNVGEIFQPGRLLHMDGVDIHTGGAVANTGLAMKILGNDVSLIGKIGDDAFGKIVLDMLGAYQAEKDMIVSAQTSTSYSVVLAIPGIDRIFLHDPGANDTFTPEDLDWQMIAQAELFHFGYPPIMKNMYQDGGRELAAMLQKVKELGTAVSLDMAAVDPASEAGKAGWKEILKAALPYVDFFVPSAEELCAMLDEDLYREWSRRAAGGDMTEILNMEELHWLGEKVLELGVRVVMIKCGSSGMYFKTAGAERLKELCVSLGLKPEEWAAKEGFEKSFEPEAVLSGTGAGDTSIAAFLTSVMRGEALEEAVQMAAATGACCVAAYDALSGLKPLEQLKEKIRKGWKKNECCI
ncbi:MAG: carbohydrate kinase family protein [Lachnospiraceae bacterium]|nr:carbohydrate kinase family protein [Lachnospiraceae bacterium]